MWDSLGIGKSVNQVEIHSRRFLQVVPVLHNAAPRLLFFWQFRESNAPGTILLIALLLFLVLLQKFNLQYFFLLVMFVKGGGVMRFLWRQCLNPHTMVFLKLHNLLPLGTLYESTNRSRSGEMSGGSNQNTKYSQEFIIPSVADLRANFWRNVPIYPSSFAKGLVQQNFCRFLWMSLCWQTVAVWIPNSAREREQLREGRLGPRKRKRTNREHPPEKSAGRVQIGKPPPSFETPLSTGLCAPKKKRWPRTVAYFQTESCKIVSHSIV